MDTLIAIFADGEVMPTDRVRDSCPEPLSPDEWKGIELLMESDLLDLHAVDEELSDMDDDGLNTWDALAEVDILLPGCTPERNRHDRRAIPAWNSSSFAPKSQKRLTPLFEICSPLKRKRLDGGWAGPGGAASLSVRSLPPNISQQITHQMAPRCRPPPPVSPQLPAAPSRLLSPPPSASRAKSTATPTKLTTLMKLTTLTMRVDSEGTALRAAAVSGSAKRSASLFVPVALNKQGAVREGGVEALRYIN